MPHMIIGTAGHIDHGKTALVHALTGVDTDRLKEEKARGLTIDLGFAHLSDNATIIDVPGHEKFVRNMVAGVSTIDLVLFVVAADDGVMPQTREHLDILKILQVKDGIIVITKKDLVESDWLVLVREDVRRLVAGSFLEEARMIPLSSVTGDGVRELMQVLEEKMSTHAERNQAGLLWLPIDRAFSMTGFGTVVTGSVLSGSATGGETVELLPKGQTYRIRGLQSHGKNVACVNAGDRAAVNLLGLEKEEVRRGDVLATPGYFFATSRLDAKLSLLKSAPRALKSRSRVRLHIGTAEIMARLNIIGAKQIERGDTGYAQLNLETPTAARRLDPFVIRQYSPTITIGGGSILDAAAPNHSVTDDTLLKRLQALGKADPIEVCEQAILSAGFGVKTLEQLISETAFTEAAVLAAVDDLERQNKVVSLQHKKKRRYAHRHNVDRLQTRLLGVLDDYHKKKPLKVGVAKIELQRLLSPNPDIALLETGLKNLTRANSIIEKDGLIRLREHEGRIQAIEPELRERISERLLQGGYSTVSAQELAGELQITEEMIGDLLSLMSAMGEIVRTEGDIFFHPSRVREAEEKLVDFIAGHGEITVGQFRDLLGGTSRKFAMPLLLYFDATGVTVREGDVRMLRPDRVG